MNHVIYCRTYWDAEAYWKRKREEQERKRKEAEAEKARLSQDPKKVIRSKKDLDRLCKSFTPEQRRMQDLMLRDHERLKHVFEPPLSFFDSDALDRDILRSRGEQNVRHTRTPNESVSEDPVVYRSVAMSPDGETRYIEMRGHVPIPLPELKKMAP